MTGKTLTTGRRGWLIPGLQVAALICGPVSSNRRMGAQTTPTPSALIQVTGRVVNAITGAAIPRALVNLNSRAVLTDAEGSFSFPQFQPNAGATQAYVLVQKPGYAAALNPLESMAQQSVQDLSVPLVLKLYPDGLISGRVTNARGEPLSKIPISVFRDTGDDAQTRMQQAGVTTTDSHGEYRFDEPPGHYAILLQYARHSDESAEVVLPARFPELTESGAAASFALSPGEERTVDILARTGVAVPVILKTDDFGERFGGMRVQAQAGSGSPLSLEAQASRTPGEYRVDLPPGTYSLRAVRQVRDRRMEAESRVSVLDRGTAPVTLHFAELPSVPVQVLLNTSSNSSGSGLQSTQPPASQSPTPATFNLRLHKIGAAEEDEFSEIGLTANGNGFAFEVGPGRYQLLSLGGGNWFIERAGYGATDLLTHPLAVNSGAGGESIRLTVSSAIGQVAGTVRRNGAGVSGYVYLFPHEPSLTPLSPVRSEADGTFSRRLPPGTYTAVAFDHRYPGDLHDSATKAEVLRLGPSVQVTAGGQASIDLDQQIVEDLK